MISVIALRHRGSSVFKLKVSIPSDNYTLELPFAENSAVKFTPGGRIDFGDGNKVDRTIANRFNTYALAGDYTITIDCDHLDGWSVHDNGSSTLPNLVLDIESWGEFRICKGAFYNCEFMTCSATDEPQLSSDNTNRVNLQYSFKNCKLFDTQTLNNLDFSVNTNSSGWSMFETFMDCYVFKGDLSTKVVDGIVRWDIEDCASMHAAFRAATEFTPPNNWNTSSVDTMFYTFYQCQGFTSTTDLSTKYIQLSNGHEYIAWDVSNSTSLQNMLSNTNLQISPNNWKLNQTSNVHIGALFFGTTTMNYSQVDLSTKIVTIGTGTSLEETYIAWDTENVISLSSFFRTNIGPIPNNWNLSSCTSLAGFGDRSTSTVTPDLSTKYIMIGQGTLLEKEYYAWDTSNVINMQSTLRQPKWTGDAGLGTWSMSSVSNLINFMEKYEGSMDLSTKTCLVLGSSGLPDLSYIAWMTSNVLYFNSTIRDSKQIDFDLNWDFASATQAQYAFRSLNTMDPSRVYEDVTVGGVTWKKFNFQNVTGNKLINAFQDYGRNSVDVNDNFETQISIKTGVLTDLNSIFVNNRATYDWTNFDLSSATNLDRFATMEFALAGNPVMPESNYDELLLILDNAGNNDGELDVDAFRSSTGTTNYNNLISKGWTIVDLGETP